MAGLIVLDVSFLHGATRRQLAELFDHYEVAIIETLFFELLDSEPGERVRRFRKLPTMESPGPLLPTVGEFMRYEIREQAPANPVEMLAITKRYRFNDRLAQPNARLTPLEAGAIAKWKEETAVLVEDYRQAASSVAGWFPNLRGFKAGQDRSLLEPYFAAVASDSELIREIYDATRPDNYPRGAEIGPDWTLFRRFQVLLFAALDHLRRYGDGNPGPQGKKAENHRLDLDYILLGLLSGGLATREELWKDCFERLRPDGILIE
jgi:hypothetical protein